MSGSQSLERGIEILELVDRSSEPLGVREIARRLSLSPAIVQRLINTLEQRGYLHQMTETRRYRIGYRAFGLGTALAREDKLIVAAGEELRRLAARHALNAFLGVLQGRRAVYVLAVQSSGPIAITARPGESMHLHSTAIGKTMLASLGDAEALALLGPAPLPKITPKSIADPALVLKQLRAVRKTGHALAIEENLPGVVSVGAPVRDAAGRTIAALSVSFAKSISPEITIPGTVRLVMEAAARVSRALGCPDAERSAA